VYIVMYEPTSIPMAARINALVCDRSLVGIAGSNLAWAWTSVSCEWRVLSGRSVWVGLITRPEESYRLWFLNMIVKPQMIRRAWTTGGCCAMENKISL